MDILTKVQEDIQKYRSEITAASTQRFFKEVMLCHGLKSKDSEKIANENFLLIKHLSKAEIFNYCETYWKSGYLEETFFACNWSYKLRKHYVPEDILIFERWIDTYINNWASCDTFCNHTVGELIEKFPDLVNDLLRWAKSENLWMRRAAAVSLIVPARKGLFLPEILQIADILLLDKEDMVQKGYGWMLKVASQVHREIIFNYVMDNKKNMPRTALRYAIEKMPDELKKQAMLK